MYNGNGGYNSNSGYTSIGGFRIKSLYLYITAAVVVVMLLYMVMSFFSAGLLAHYGAFAGLLLLISNVRELISTSTSQRSSVALLNVLIGAGLVCAWLVAFIGALMWIPAIALIGIATPLIFGRASVYRGYIGVARSAASSVRRTLIR